MNPFASDLEPLSGLDGAFLSLETPATPMHVGSLNLFERPADYAGDWLIDVKTWLAQRLPPVLRRRLVEMPLQLAHPLWQIGEVDLDWHVQRVQIPAPGGWAQLEDMVAQLHSQPLERSRPLWQLTLLDGLASGERALYFKIHHAMLDGQAAAALASSLFGQAPSDWPAAAPAQLGSSAGKPAANANPSLDRASTFNGNSNAKSSSGPDSSGSGTSSSSSTTPRRPDALSLLKVGLQHDASQAVRLARGLPGALKTLSGLIRSAAAGDIAPRAGLQAPGQAGPVFAPRTPINGAITAERGFATLALPLAEVKAIARTCQVSANDVVLTALGGALQRYLARLGPLPEASLVALMALSLRQRGNTEYHNQATLSLVSLATHLTNPLQRIQAVHGHTRATKVLAQRAKSLMPTDFPTLGQPWLVGAFSKWVERAGTFKRLPPLANVLVSSVTGPAWPLYLGPARLTGYWPISIVEHGVGINLTLLRYTGQLFVGLTVARAVVPDASLLADDLLQAYSALKIAALPPVAATRPD